MVSKVNAALLALQVLFGGAAWPEWIGQVGHEQIMH